MTYDVLGHGVLDYLPCRYGTSKLLFRGPRRNLDKAPYVAFIGGTETYGKFIEKPFPTLVEEQSAITAANFGFPNAGIDAFAHDPFVTGAASDARLSVIQVMGAANMTNRFYSVHPRRNDRFVAASKLLKTIFREVDFAEFNYNKHMLNHLIQISPDRFETVRMELQEAWVARMRLMLGQMRGKTILLWFAAHAPGNQGGIADSHDIGPDPLFVTREMIDELREFATDVVEVVASKEAVTAGTDGMIFGELEEPAAKEMLGPLAHAEAASAICRSINKLT